jgi:hypothetical protein
MIRADVHGALVVLFISLSVAGSLSQGVMALLVIP